MSLTCCHSGHTLHDVICNIYVLYLFLSQNKSSLSFLQKSGVLTPTLMLSLHAEKTLPFKLIPLINTDDTFSMADQNKKSQIDIHWSIFPALKLWDLIGTHLHDFMRSN